jgi:hypothetical protein
MRKRDVLRTIRHWPVLIAASIGLLAFQTKVAENEPIGFGDIRWGQDISELKNLVALEKPNLPNGLKIFARKNEKLQLGTTPLSGVEYGFQDGKFSMVTIEAQGKKSFDGLMAYFEKLHGNFTYHSEPMFVLPGGDPPIWAWYFKDVSLKVEFLPSETVKVSIFKRK